MSNAFAFHKCTDCSCKACQIPQIGSINRTTCVIVNHQGASLYETKDSPIVKRKLNFNDKFYLKNAYNKRVEVTNSNVSVGWVDKQYLHCGVEPLRYRNGLPMQCFIKTAAQNRKKICFVKAYFSSDPSCKQFQKLYRFTRYLIVDEKDNRFLLAYNYSSTNEDNLLGWVEQDDLFFWDTRCELRPSENLIISDKPKKGSKKQLFIYMNKDDAEKKLNGKPVLSGDRYCKLKKRILIIGSDEKYYKVVAIPEIVVKYNQILCQDNEMDAIIEGYIPKSEKWEKGIYLEKSTFDVYVKDIGTIVSMLVHNNVTEPSVFTNVLMKTLELFFYFSIKDLSKPLSKLLLLKHELPVDHDSPLFKQSLNELQDKIERQPVLIDNLTIWLTAKLKMLKIVQNEKKVTIEGKSKLRGWYLNQPYIDPNKIKGKPFPKGMCYLHDDDGPLFYWVPIKFLP